MVLERQELSRKHRPSFSVGELFGGLVVVAPVSDQFRVALPTCARRSRLTGTGRAIILVGPARMNRDTVPVPVSVLRLAPRSPAGWRTSVPSLQVQRDFPRAGMSGLPARAHRAGADGRGPRQRTSEQKLAALVVKELTSATLQGYVARAAERTRERGASVAVHPSGPDRG